MRLAPDTGSLRRDRSRRRFRLFLFLAAAIGLTFGALGAFRGYVSPFAPWVDLVLAGRLAYQVQTEGTPFFSMNILPFTEDFRLGLGGVRTLRGYKQDRFVGPVMIVTNLELRWTMFHVDVLDQDFGFILVPFVDLGRLRLYDYYGSSAYMRPYGYDFRARREAAE